MSKERPRWFERGGIIPPRDVKTTADLEPQEPPKHRRRRRSSKPKAAGLVTPYPVRLSGRGAVTSNGRTIRFDVTFATKIRPRGRRGARR